ncbi:hypothetical protein PCARR_a3034 [Pseudoalteromonas carrageenovora IAM 12662]|uniref:Uncharacterized protein n=1 Tax=Pseudoalteromonas carrageenovora IAM 12662 TaxID=1314868 RepID=A0ABR9EL59_PSEVC|nr:hypothetical protein [Pseudoalteromonas carrageenovora IAM 12662]
MTSEFLEKSHAVNKKINAVNKLNLYISITMSQQRKANTNNHDYK